MVKVVPLQAEETPQRLGFMRGRIKIADDFDTMGQDEIERMFYGE